MKPGTANLHSIRLKPRMIGFVVKHHHPEASELAVELGKLVLSKGCPVLFAEESSLVAHTLIKATSRAAGSTSGRTANGAQAKAQRKAKAGTSGKAQTHSQPKVQPKVQIVPQKIDLVTRCDLIIVLGGDGTFLSIARLMRTRSVPVMGINMGQLGFLTEVKRSEAFETLGRIFEGKPMPISERALLEVTLRRDGKIIHRGPVVNDAVISKGAIARIIGLQIAVNGRWAHNVRADGIIVSTPTGSTAYSLAAGGPIIEPSLSAVVMTPICPHSLTQRPLVIPDEAEIRIHLTQRPGHVLLTLDGQDAVDMKEADTVTVRRFKKHSLKLISSPTRDYFSLLREKLRFGERE